MALPEIRPTERFEQSVLALAALFPDGRLAAVNDALCRLAAVPRERLVGRAVTELCERAPDRSAVTAVLDAAAAGDAGGEACLTLLCGDGASRTVRVAWTLIRDGGGEPSYLTAALVDETERVRAEQALAAGEARWRSLLAHSTGLTWTADRDGVLLSATPGMLAARLGWPFDGVVGRSVFDLLHPDDVAAFRAAFEPVASGAVRQAQVECRVRGADGGWLWVRDVLTDLQDDPHVRAVVGSVIDISERRREEEARARQEAFFRALSQRATDAAVVADADGRILYASPAVTHVLGHDPAESVGRAGWDFVHRDDLPRVRELYGRVVAEGGVGVVMMRVRDRAGNWLWVEETATNLLDTPIGGVVCNLRDVTARVEAEEALRVSEARYRAIAETAQEGICTAACDGEVVFVNERLADMLGVPVADLRARTADDALEADGAERVLAGLAGRGRHGPERYEIDYPHPDGGLRRLLVAVSPLSLEDGRPGWLAMFSDVTETRRAEEELRRLALHDALTGLPNRALLLDRLEHALARESVGTAVLFIDLDQFKLVNDSRGHAVGDELLVAVAGRLREAVRPGDTVARFGGDEFVVVCEDVVPEQAVGLAGEVLAALQEPVLLDAGVVHVGASIGVAVSPVPSADDLLRYADTAMYAAKTAGRRRVRLFDQALSEDVEQRFTVAAQLRAALEQDELELHYQPVVDLATGAVLGVEALARWNSPVLGPVPPTRFVTVAETTGLSAELDLWAVRRALREVAALRAQGALPPAAYVAVNLSARNLSDLGLEEQVAAAAEAAGLAPGDVVLEITESALVDDAQCAAQLLSRLRRRGFHVAVDDFGTGYSSLAYLRNMPITSLKIDRSFISGMEDDADALAIVASIVDLARAVGVTTVAEGIETDAQAELLRRLGCPAGQGWLWTRALPPAQVPDGGWELGLAAAPGPGVEAPGRRRPKPVVRAEHGLSRLLELHRQGASLATIAAALNREGFRTPDGLRWHRVTVARAVAEAAYPQLAAAPDVTTRH